jgi:hypothetical protein
MTAGVRCAQRASAVRTIVACILALTLAACGAASKHALPPDIISSDVRNELQQIVHAQTECFAREAQNKSLNKVDINTAALAVQARCVRETAAFKAFAARHTIDAVNGGIEGYENRMRQDDADDLQYIRQVLALVRTSK